MHCLQKFLNPLRPYYESPRSMMLENMFEKKSGFIQRKIEIKQSRKEESFTASLKSNDCYKNPFSELIG